MTLHTNAKTDVPQGAIQGRPLRLLMAMTDLEDFGVQRIVINLYKHFDRRTIDPLLLLWKREGRVAEFLPADATVVETDRCLGRPRFLRRLPKYLKIIEDYDPDAILSFVPGTNLSMALLRRCFPHIPLVTSEHAFISRAFELGEYTGAFATAYRALLNYAYNIASDRLIMTAEAGVEDAVKNWGIQREKVVLIYNPQDIGDLTARAAVAPGDEWFENQEMPVIVGAGRLVEQKGFDLLIDAFVRLRKRQACRLVILGRGHLDADLKERVLKAGVQRDVRFLGFQSNHLSYIKNAAIFALASRWEAMPMVLGEAMAVGTPIVAFDCPSGPRELLDKGRCGWLVPDQDVDALASALEEALSDPVEAKRRARLAFERVSKFDVKIVAKRYEELIRSEVALKSQVAS